MRAFRNASLAVLFAGTAPDALDDAALERLARIEHRRWIAERIEHGWRHGAQRDDAARRHPALCPYDALPPELRDGLRAQVATLAAATARIRAR